MNIFVHLPSRLEQSKRLQTYLSQSITLHQICQNKPLIRRAFLRPKIRDDKGNEFILPNVHLIINDSCRPG